MKNQEKLVELKEYIDASGIEEAIQTLQELFGEYMRSEKINSDRMQEKRKKVGLGVLEVLTAIWKMEKTLEFVLEESEEPIGIGWEEPKKKQNSEAPYW